ncbi:hypothetical protein B0T24DRAFT_387382 [Lasiosphaeria ovina]|uniref:GPI anchored protein n=1 Tax=Lasiosphaeria ovina TaxID=92902 RepID=A0AAE0JZG0_9PEZI|nr:hypothetical protein B0T24DRAFT_387382 [Lasiosphaeria ovina]
MLLNTLPLASLLASLAVGSRLPPLKGHVYRAAAADPPPAVYLPSHHVYDAAPALERRFSANDTFDFNFGYTNKNLWKGTWNGGSAPIPPIPIGPIPLTIKPEGAVSLSLDCNECRTYGTVDVELSTDAGLFFLLTFRDAGAIVDLGVTASAALTVKLQLGGFIDPHKNFTTGSFNATLDLGVELVLSLTAGTTLSGGFQLCIPDGAQLGFDIGISPDPQTGLLATDAALKTLPGVNFSLLPLSVDTNVNVTAALILSAAAGIDAALGPITGKIGAGATVTLIQLKFGETSHAGAGTGQCPLALFVDGESNGGASANLAAGTRKPFLDKAAHTVFATAGATTCLFSKPSPVAPPSQSLPQALLSPQPTTSCAPGAALVTQLDTVTHVNTLTSCLAPVVDCPSSLAQVVVLTQTDTVTATRCADATTSATPDPAPLLLQSATTTITATTIITIPSSSTSTLLNNSSSAIAQPPAAFANVSAPANATVTALAGVFPSGAGNGSIAGQLPVTAAGARVRGPVAAGQSVASLVVGVAALVWFL